MELNQLHFSQPLLYFYKRYRLSAEDISRSEISSAAHYKCKNIYNLCRNQNRVIPVIYLAVQISNRPLHCKKKADQGCQ